jgi:hypothetical protein
MSMAVDAGLAEALATLGLRSDADARSVRRAYAQQVKQIDQATQLQAFQTLREAYERALGTISRREAQARDSSPVTAAPLEVEPAAPASPTAATEFTPPDSAELARAVFEGFALRADAGFKDETEATSALQDALADDRLLNLEARTLFELRVAHRIMEGWQPGHEFLLGPACEAFDWERDRAHLRVFGQLGAALDAAINEKLIFFSEHPGRADRLHHVIERLRGDQAPTSTWLREERQFVQLLVQRYPNWLRLVTSQANINNWFEARPAESQPDPATTAHAEANQEPMVANDRYLQATPPPLVTALRVIVCVLIGVFLIFYALKGSVRPQAPSDSVPSATTPRLAADIPPSAREQLIHLGDVSFLRRGNEVIVDDLGEGAFARASTLQVGDRLQPCGDGGYHLPLTLLAEAGRCGMTKRVDLQAGLTTYTFQVLRGNRSLTASVQMRATPGDAVAQSSPDRGAEPRPGVSRTFTWVSPSQSSKPADVFRLGHVSFALIGDRVVVQKVGPSTNHSSGTLEVGDRMMRCMLGDGRLPLTRPADVQGCTAKGGADEEPGVTPYRFRVWRNGQSTPASLTLREKPP